MTAPLSGGCACGAVRYTVEGPPKFTLICQCRDCQHMTGTGHAVQFVVNRDGFHLSGPVAQWARRTAAGHEVTKTFCPACGSPLFTVTGRAPDRVMVLAGSLDDPSGIAPSRIFFDDEAQPWDHPTLPEE